jgi:hypothetical protein
MMPMRRWLKPLWILLALLFLLEAWLWDRLKRVVAAVVDALLLDAAKEALRRGIERLPPWAALGVFVVPFLVLLPLKFAEVYFLATRRWLFAALVLLLAKLLGLGVTAFVFDATRDKLMQMGWFVVLYGWVMAALDWAHAQIEPFEARLRHYLSLLRPRRAGRFFRLFWRIRRRAQRA